MEIKIEQSSVRPDIWFLYFGELTMQLSEDQVIELARATMRTSVGREMLGKFADRHSKRVLDGN